MKVLFAVSNESISEGIVKQYQKEYKEILSYKNVYYFNAILKEIQKDKTYDRIIISEELESFANNNYEAIDKFLFEKLDNISDEAQDSNGQETSIIFICTDRRTKGSSFLVKLFSIGVYNALLGNDRVKSEVCKLINKPRIKKEAKMYYKIDAEDATYDQSNEKEVSEIEIQSILSHFKKLGKNTDKYADSFNNIAMQYTDEQLKIIINCLPNSVKAVLEEDSPKYQEMMQSFGGIRAIRASNSMKEEEKRTGIKMDLMGSVSTKIDKPIIIPSSVRKVKSNTNKDTSDSLNIHTQSKVSPKVNEDDVIDEDDFVDINKMSSKNQKVVKSNMGMQNVKKVQSNSPVNKVVKSTQNMNVSENVKEMKKQTLNVNNSEEAIRQRKISKDISPLDFERNVQNDSDENADIMQNDMDTKRGRGRPRKTPIDMEPKPKGKRGRPRKVAIEDENLLPGFEEETEENLLPGFNNEQDDEIGVSNFDTEVEENEELELPGFDNEVEEDEELELPGFDDEVEEDEELELPGFDDEVEEDEELELPGFDDEVEEDEELELPGFDDEIEEDEELELPGFNDEVEEDEELELPGFDDEVEEDEELELPGFDDEVEEDEELELPGFDDEVEEDEELELPGFDDEVEEDEELELPGFNDEVEEDEELELPGFDDEVEEDEELELPGFDNEVEEDEELELPGFDDESEEGEELELPGFDDESEEDEELELPGFDDESEEDEELELPGFDNEVEEDEELELPGFDNEVEEDEELELPGFDEEVIEEDDESELPDFDEVVEEDDESVLSDFDEEVIEEDKSELSDFDEVEEDDESALSDFDDEIEEDEYTDEVSLPDLDGLDDIEDDFLPDMEEEELEEEEEIISDTGYNEPEETVLPGMGFEDEIATEDEEILSSNNHINNMNNNVNNIGINTTNGIESISSKVDYSMSSLNSLLTKEKKIVAFLGTTKNGTSFLINHLGLLFSSLGINTAILDMTKNKNSYYIYTKNEEELRKRAYTSISKLQDGYVEGIKANKNLSIYTALPNDGKDYSNAEPILSTLVQNYSLVLIDCDFDTDPSYFASCQELYLVQSMDILTIQPLTAFLKELKVKGVLEPEKIRVVVNKEIKVRGLTTKLIITGMSSYNDPSMSFMTELFNKDIVKACSIGFDENACSKYMENVAKGIDLSLNGYSKQFISKLRVLGEMVYPLTSKQTYGKKSGPISQDYSTNTFSNSMNNTLNQMRKKY